MKFFSKTSCAAFAAVAAIALPLVLSAGCGKNSRKNSNQKIVVIDDPMEKWSSIRGKGEEGKQLCEHGMKTYQEASTDEDRKKAQEMMSRGMDMVSEACDQGADLIEAAKRKHPGHDFGGYDDEMSRWSQAQWQARKFASRD